MKWPVLAPPDFTFICFNNYDYIRSADVLLGRHAYFAPQCEMVKPPNARLPVIKLDLINRSSGKTDSIYEAIIRWPSTLILIQVNSKLEWWKWLLKLVSVCLLMFCLFRMQYGAWKLAHLCSKKLFPAFLLRVLAQKLLRSWVTSRGNCEIKSKLLVLAAVNTALNDQGCQHVTGRFESIRMLLNKPAGWPIFVQSHLTVKTVDWFKKQLSLNLPTYRKGEN